jgi:hypothetical protein
VITQSSSSRPRSHVPTRIASTADCAVQQGQAPCLCFRPQCRPQSCRIARARRYWAARGGQHFTRPDSERPVWCVVFWGNWSPGLSQTGVLKLTEPASLRVGPPRGIAFFFHPSWRILITQ